MELRRGPSRHYTRIALALLLLAVPACGASIQAVYEGDVRFEHCMALDSRPDVKPTIRRACWEEWQKFYTFGQTRDRVEFAHLREKQLSMASDFDEGDWAMESARNSKAVPEPTSVLAPPPMMLGSPQHDAGAATDAAAAPATSAKAGASEQDTPPSADCSDECQEGWNLCRQECRTPACEKACTGKYKRCMRKCF